MLKDRRWVILGVVATVVFITFAFSFLSTPKYRATAQLVYETMNLESLVDTSVYRTAQQARDVETGAQLVKVDQVAEAVQKSLQASGYARTKAELLEMVDVQLQAQTDVVRISATSTDPAEAAAVANAFATEFVDFRRDQAQQAIRDAAAVLKGTLDELTTAGGGDPEDIARLTGKLEDLSVAEQLQTGGFRVVENAVVPTAPFAPQPLRNGILALVAGLLLGVTLAFVLDFADRRIKDEAGMERAFGLPVLAAVPQVGGKWLQRGQKRDVAPVGFASQPGPLLEAFRVLRSNLQYFDIDQQLKTLLVTSSLPDEGKTVTAVNLAYSLALSGKRVILIDADLRKPMLHDYIGLSNQLGVTNVLAATHTLGESMQLIEADTFVPSSNGASGGRTLSDLEKNLYVLTSGPLPPNPAELLASKRMEEVIAAAGRSADVVLVDSPPLLLVADGLSLAKQVDGVIIATRAGKTTTTEAGEATRLLQRVGAKPIGVVVGGVKPAKSYYRQGYGYGAT